MFYLYCRSNENQINIAVQQILSDADSRAWFRKSTWILLYQARPLVLIIQKYQIKLSKFCLFVVA